jgi:hypothetical protein
VVDHNVATVNRLQHQHLSNSGLSATGRRAKRDEQTARRTPSASSEAGCQPPLAAGEYRLHQTQGIDPRE